MSSTQFVRCNSLVEETNVVCISLGRLYAQIHLLGLSVATLRTLLSMLAAIDSQKADRKI